MALHPSRQEELRQLLGFRDLIGADPKIAFRIEIAREAHDYSQLLVKFIGLTTLVVNGSSYRKTTEPITAHFSIPPGHAATTRVTISFRQPVPFHPHVFPSGSICWGSVSNEDAGSWTLVMWTIALLEYVQFNQQTFIGINPNSPANRDANDWWKSHRTSISRNVPPVDLARVRQLSYQVR